MLYVLEFHQKTRLYHVSSLHMAKRIIVKKHYFIKIIHMYSHEFCVYRQFPLYKLITKELFAFETVNRN